MVETNETAMEMETSSSFFDKKTSKTMESDGSDSDLLLHERQTQAASDGMIHQQHGSENENVEKIKLLCPDIASVSDLQTREKENNTASHGECHSFPVTQVENNIFSYSRKENEVDGDELESSCSFPPKITPGQRSGRNGHLSTDDDSDSTHSVTKTGKTSKKRRQRKSALDRSKKKSLLNH